ncbi:MAG: hypothetical protein NTW17_02615 [Candidatus Pacearchaeota archaeon]|nr:hypothetical protein [Candidatus Pacearchaeota archaeon]
MNKKAYSKIKGNKVEIVLKTAPPKSKRIAKKNNKNSKPTEVIYHSTKEIKVEKALIENFIGLQKVMVNLSVKFDNLSNQISKLLDLFEISAKALAKKEISAGDLEAKKVMEKLNKLSEQAGLIGKGLALIHEVGTENQRPVIPLPQKNKIQYPLPAPSPPLFSSTTGIQPSQKMTQELEGFEKSITAKDQKPFENP